MKNVKQIAKKSTGSTVATSAKTTKLYSTMVVATKKAQAFRQGSFFADMALVAHKPIALGKLVTVVASGVKLRSKVPAKQVAHVRVRDAFTRLGLLKKVA